MVPDQSSPLGTLGMGGIAVEEVGGVGALIILLADKLDQVSINHCWRHLCNPE